MKMLKNCVLRKNVNTLEWFKNAGVRAAKTFAETFVGLVTVGQALTDVNWEHTLSVCAVAAICSLAVSVAGIKEVEAEEKEE